MARRWTLVVALLVLTGSVGPGVAAAGTTSDGPVPITTEETRPTATVQPGVSTTTQPSCTYPQTLTDVTGTEVTIPEEPASVVALQPSDAQLMTEIGATDTLVGMPIGPYTSHLAVPDDVTDISADDGVTPVAEKVIALDADVVIAANTVLYLDGFVETLRDANQTVYVYDSATSIDDVRDNVRIAGTLSGNCDGATDTIREMNESLKRIDAVTSGQDRPLAYYVMGEDDLTTAGNGTFQHEILTRAGVENIAIRAGIDGWAAISEEVIVEEDPKWIIYGESLGKPPDMEALSATTAWERDQFVAVDDNAMSQPGPHVIEAIEKIAATVHAQSYAEVTNETSTNDTNEQPNDDSPTPDSAGGDTIPGFGLGAAVVALLTVSVLGYRRC